MGQSRSSSSLNGLVLILVAIATIVSCAVIFVPDAIIEDIQCAIFSTACETPEPTATERPDPAATNTSVPRPTSTEAIPTNVVPQATNTSVSVPTVTPTEVIALRVFPCDAIVDSGTSSTMLNVVREFPLQTANIVDSVRQGATVTLIEQSNGTPVFYRVQSGGRTIGWVQTQYLNLSASCP